MLTKTAPTKQVNNGLNPWSDGKIIKIPVYNWGFDFQPVTWKGKTISLEYELFIMLVKYMMQEYSWTKERALDEIFDSM